MNWRYLFRILALAGTVLCSILFLPGAVALTKIYFRYNYHFPSFIPKRDFMEAAVSGIGVFCLAFLYISLVRTPRRP